jgi:UDP-N-acetylglucosamine 2-epimerase
MVFLKTALNKISKSEDKEVEAILLKIEKKIYSDNQINSVESNKNNKELETYILNNYLQEINKIYSTDIIVCYSDEALFIPPLGKHINSKEYFKTRLQDSRLVINSKSIYRESTDLTEKAYIGYFELNHKNRTRLIFIDCIEKKASKEMAPGLGKPVLVMRDTTERPEAVEAGTVKLVGTNYQTIMDSVSCLLSDSSEYEKMSKANNPYGDGKACERIINKILEITE